MKEKNFSIYGTIVDNDADKTSFEDVTPTQFKSYISKLEKDDDLILNINSCGGSVTGGIAIANMIKSLQANGHNVTAKIDGLAASIASVIACACNEVIMGSGAFLMIHNCWGTVQGNANDLRKEADIMEKMNKAIISFYRSKFNKTDDELQTLMDAETWFSGNEAKDFGFHCTVIDSEPVRIAAKLLTYFNNKEYIEKIMKNTIQDKEISKEQIETIEESVSEVKEAVEELKKNIEEVVVSEEVEEEKTEEVTEEETTEAITEEPSEVKEETAEEKTETVKDAVETVPVAEVEKRVSGMQSTMAKKMDALKKDYDAKINDFITQLKVKDEELTKVNALVTSLTDDLNKAQSELHDCVSALSEKTNALAQLNANVNTPEENKEVDYKTNPREYLKWIDSRKNQSK